MKLLFVNYMETTAAGGINTVVREVGGALAHRGHEVTVLQPNLQHRASEELCQGFRIRRVGAPLSGLLYGFDIQLWGDMAVLYSTITPDVVHVHGFHSLFSAEAVYCVRRMAADVPLVLLVPLGRVSRAVLGETALERVQTGRKEYGGRAHPCHRIFSVRS